MSRKHSPKLIAALVAGAFFMENLDGTVIATALPQMGQSFHANPVDLNVGMTAYMLMLAVFIPISGWMADRIGTRTVFVSAIAIFTLSSIACGFSNGLWAFTSARVVQGIGGAMMVPVGRLVVLRTTEKNRLLHAIATITWPGLIAPVVGPPVGGFITTYASWRWIFFLNVPLGAIAMVLSIVWIANMHEQSAAPFDWLGFILPGGACLTFMYGMELVGRENMAWRQPMAYLASGAALGVAALFYFSRAKFPLIDLSLFKIKTLAVVLYGGSLFRIGISVAPFLLPLMFQVGFGLNPFQSGSLLLALFAGNLAMKPLTTPVLKRFGFRSVLLVNGVLAALTTLLGAALFPQTARWMILTVLFAGGLTRSMQFTALNTLAFADIPKTQLGGATSLFSMVTQLSMGMGVATGAILLRLAAWMHGDAAATPGVKDFHIAIELVAALIALAIADCFVLAADAGADVTGHRAKRARREAVVEA